MVRPVDGSSPAATPSSVDDKKTFGEKFYAAAAKCAFCALTALIVGAAAAVVTTVDSFKSDYIAVRLTVSGVLLGGALFILPVALAASTSALPVIAAVGSVIAGLAMGVGAFSLAMLIAIPIVIAGVSIVMGWTAATYVILK